ncbi:MAG: hypothetical protein R3343_13705 [Nitriliruptorales bacterium]|nr:hypothetical protein [Nitriliruptorales bacterium]
MAGARLSSNGSPTPIVDDGRPTLPTGEPVLARWFVVLMLVLVPVGLAVIVWAFIAASGGPLPPAERRPPGTAEVTHDRGEATLAESVASESGPSCASGITVVGDSGGRATGTRALGALCQLLRNDDYPLAEAGLEAWSANDGRLRVAVFERSGLDSSARVEDGAIVIEINPKFQFEDAVRAAPAILHELVHLGQSWPGEPVTAAQEIAAVQAQARACDTLVFVQQEPRGCLDAVELLELDAPRDALVDAGFPAR